MAEGFSRRLVTAHCIASDVAGVGMPHRSAGFSLAPAATCAVLTLLGFALRFYHLGDQPLWRDETVVYWLGNESLGRLWSADLALTGIHPPLFYTLHHFWNAFLDVIGVMPSEVTVRLPSVIIGTLSVPLFYFLLGGCFSNRVAAIGAACIAASPAHIEFSRYAKSEVLVVFLLIALLGFTVRLFTLLAASSQEPHDVGATLKSRPFLVNAAGYVASAILLLHAHSTGFVGLFIPSVMFVTLLLTGRLRLRAVPLWIALNLLVVAGFARWMVLLYRIARANTGYYWLQRIDFSQAVGRSLYVFLDKYTPPFHADTPFALIVDATPTVIVGWLLLLGCIAGLRRGAERRGIIIALLTLPLLFFALSEIRPIFEHYILMMFALPMVALAYGFASERWKPGRLASVVMVAAIVLLLLPADSYVYRESKGPWNQSAYQAPKEPWNKIGAFLATHVAGQEAVLFWPAYAEWSTRFYWRTDTTDWRSVNLGRNAEYRPLDTVPAIPLADVAGFTRDTRRVWVVEDQLEINAGDLAALHARLASQFPDAFRTDFPAGLRVIEFEGR
ncbi:MAG: glycosyltransferase family 39 protein [Acetobacteraceae bacterium]